MKKYNLFLLLILILSSCCTVEMKFDYDTFKQERKAWETSKPQAFEYTYHLNSTAEKILVQYSDEKYQMINTFDNKEYTYSSYMTIESIYEDIENTYKECNQATLNPCNNQIIDIEIEYDKTNHIPTYIHYELYNENQVMGAGSTVIADFKVTE